MRISIWRTGADPTAETLILHRSTEGWSCPAGRALDGLLPVEPDGAVRIDFGPEEGSVWDVVAALPSESRFARFHERELSTGDALLDVYGDGVGLRVVINGQRWALVAASHPMLGGDRWNWVPCAIDERWGEVTAPITRREISSAAGIEEGSRTSGWFSWTLSEIDDEAVCFEIDLDEEGRFCEVLLREGRSDLDLTQDLLDRVDWDPVYLAIEAALSRDGVFEGYADSLDPSLSNSCLIKVILSLDDHTGS